MVYDRLFGQTSVDYDLQYMVARSKFVMCGRRIMCGFLFEWPPQPEPPISSYGRRSPCRSPPRRIHACTGKNYKQISVEITER